MDLGKEIGENREWAGVHYRSDTLAGHMLANHICDHFFADRPQYKFTDELVKKARAEWYENRPDPDSDPRRKAEHNVYEKVTD